MTPAEQRRRAIPPRRYEPVGRLNAISPYYTMFPLEFPFRWLSRARSTGWVLDPFCGRGTTNFAARLLNLPSVGVDSNPVASAIAASKFVSVRPSEVVQLCRSILNTRWEPKNVPHGRFWRLCYHPRTLEEICKLREDFIRDCSSQARVALRAVLLGILHGPRQKLVASYLSNQMPRTYATKPTSAIKFWLKRKLRPSRVDVLELVKRRASYVFSDIPPKTMGRILRADIRNISSRQIRARFRWVVTSPPYLGMRSYKSDQWLRNWFLGGPPQVDYTHNGQLSHHSQDEFVRDLASAWRRVSGLCLPGAHLIVRFGALPSVKRNPVDLLKKSIRSANCGWAVRTVRRAGRASHGKRQACQFIQTGMAIEEIDLHAVLET
jgi:hypothetical protein